MSDKCKNCFWYYSDSCCSESYEDLINDKTHMTDSCNGFLRKDFEHQMATMKAKLLVYCKDESVSKKIKNMSYNATIETYNKVFK